MVLVPAFLMVSTDPVPQLQVDRPGHAALVSRPAAHGAGHRRDRHAPADHAGRRRLRLPGVRPDRAGRGDVWLAAPRRRRRRPTLPRARRRSRRPTPDHDARHASTSGRADRPVADRRPCSGATAGRVSGSAIVTVVPTPRVDCDGDGAAVQLDVAPGDAQAQAGAARLGREVRLEDPRRAPRRPCRRRCRRCDSSSRVAVAPRRRPSACRRPASRAARSRGC